MAIADIDLRYAHALRGRINALVVNGTPLGTRTIFGEYALWQAYQQDILEDCKEFSRMRGRESMEGKDARSIALRGAIAALCGASMVLLAELRMLLARPAVLVFSIDRCSDPSRRHDFRMDGAYRFLRDEGISYAELLHTFYGPDFFRNMLRRKAPALYLESLALPARLFGRKRLEAVETIDLTGFDEREAVFVRALVTRYFARIPRTEARIGALVRLLSRAKTRHVIAIDDGRNLFDILVATERASVPVTVLQHGHITKYSVGILRTAGVEGRLPLPQAFFVWSEYWKREYARQGGFFPEASVIVAGNPTMSATLPGERAAHEGVTVLVPYEIDGAKRELRAYLAAFAACPRTRVLFKLRPDLPAARQCEEYGISQNDPVIEASTSNDLLARADLVAGSYSTYLYTAIEAGKPVAMLATPSDFGEGMLVNGLAEELALGEGFCERVGEIAQTPAVTLASRREKLLGTKPPDLFLSLRRALEVS